MGLAPAIPAAERRSPRGSKGSMAAAACLRTVNGVAQQRKPRRAQPLGIASDFGRGDGPQIRSPPDPRGQCGVQQPLRRVPRSRWSMATESTTRWQCFAMSTDSCDGSTPRLTGPGACRSRRKASACSMPACARCAGSIRWRARNGRSWDLPPTGVPIPTFASSCPTIRVTDFDSNVPAMPTQLRLKLEAAWAIAREAAIVPSHAPTLPLPDNTSSSGL